MKNFKVSVFNTCTKKYEMVEVSEEVYRVYKRTEWNMDKGHVSFSKHQTPLSLLSNGFEENPENLSGYLQNCKGTYESDITTYDLHDALEQAMKILSTRDRNLIKAIYFEGYNETDYADRLGVSQQCINNRKNRILRILRKELEKTA